MAIQTLLSQILIGKGWKGAHGPALPVGGKRMLLIRNIPWADTTMREWGHWAAWRRYRTSDSCRGGGSRVWPRPASTWWPTWGMITRVCGECFLMLALNGLGPGDTMPDPPPLPDPLCLPHFLVQGHDAAPKTSPGHPPSTRENSDQLKLNLTAPFCFKSDPIYNNVWESALAYKAFCNFCHWQHYISSFLTPQTLHTFMCRHTELAPTCTPITSTPLPTPPTAL